MLSPKYSFKFLSRSKAKNLNLLSQKEKVEAEDVESDSSKRSLLKLLGVVGAGAVAASLLPKKAEALVFGSTPTSNVIGVKNSSNVRVNPATEDTLSSIKTNTDNLASIKTGTDNLTGIKTGTDYLGTIKTNTDNLTGINTSIGSIKTNTDKFKFDGDNLKVIGSDTTGQTVTDESMLLRRMLNLLRPLGIVTGNGSNRLSMDVNYVTGGNLNTVTTVSNVGSVASVTNQVSTGGINSFDLMKNSSRSAYINAIRSNISF